MERYPKHEDTSREPIRNNYEKIVCARPNLNQKISLRKLIEIFINYGFDKNNRKYYI